MKTFILVILTALAEISGCFAAYAVLRQGRPFLWLLEGAGTLALFAWLLTLHPADGAGRIYAAYGGVYIAASLLWLWSVRALFLTALVSPAPFYACSGPASSCSHPEPDL